MRFYRRLTAYPSSESHSAAAAFMDQFVAPHQFYFHQFGESEGGNMDTANSTDIFTISCPHSHYSRLMYELQEEKREQKLLSLSLLLLPLDPLALRSHQL